MTERPAGDSIPDEEWEKFLRDSESGAVGDAPKEPSARARIVAERLRQQDARGETPAGWRAGPTWEEMNGRKVRRRRVWTAVGVVAAVAVVAVALKPSLLPGDPFGTGGPDVAASPLPAETAAPTDAPAEAPPQTPTLDAPFAGSPALRWADGEAGIVLPKARAVGGASKERVEQALRLTRKLVVGANLDPKVLRGERPTAALGVLDPKQPNLVDHLKAGLRSPSKKRDPLQMFSRFDPDEVRLVGDVVKTRGRVTFKKGAYNGVAVHADYTFVYPVVRTDGSTEVTRTIVRRVLDVELSDPAHYDATPGRLAVLKHDQEVGNSSCDVYDGYLHPEFSRTESTGPSPTGPTTDPYDRSKGLDEDGSADCGTVSRV
ncbi:hypothetical protein [Streptomyces griseus]|uniref:hypothetical protein n=1 Tax=Streptomyces griseus TaxID=1911 RepID=UPI00055F310D|nr:hypothetical protein [Streptomyces griseus]